MNRKFQAVGAGKRARPLLFLCVLLFVAPLVGCSKKSTTDKWRDCINNFGWDTCRTYPRIIDNNAAWSPDGKTIAYVHGGLAQPGIYLIDTAGNNRKVLVPAASAIQPAFSPDGQWIAFANLSDDAIYKIKINGDSLTRLTAGNTDQEPAWSPDGKWIVFSSKENPGDGLRMVSSDGGQDSSLLPVGLYPNWSKDGKRILAISGFYEQGIFQFYIIIYNRADSSSKKLLKLGYDAINWGYLRWNPDNSKILLTVKEAGDEQYVWRWFLYTMDSSGQNLQKLSNILSYEGAWAPDGRRIVYTDTRPEYGTLFIMDSDGRNKRQITLTNLPKKSPGR